MAYGPNRQELWRRAATFVHKILRALSRRTAGGTTRTVRPGHQCKDGPAAPADDPAIGAGASGSTHRVAHARPTRPVLIRGVDSGRRRVVWVRPLPGGCAIANTPQQDLAYARWAKCNSSSIPVELERVDLDGQITFRFGPGGQEVWQCLAEAGRTGAPLPEPVGVCPPRGP